MKLSRLAAPDGSSRWNPRLYTDGEVTWVHPPWRFLGVGVGRSIHATLVLALVVTLSGVSLTPVPVAAQTPINLALPLILRAPDLVGGEIHNVTTLATSADLVIAEVNSVWYYAPNLPLELWYSRDAGGHWQQPATRPWLLEPGNYWNAIRYTAIASVSGPLLVAGRTVSTEAEGFVTAIYVSADFGDTWTRRLVPPLAGCSALGFESFATSPAQPDRLYLTASCVNSLPFGSSSQVWIATSDAGLTWQPVIGAEIRGYTNLLSPAQSGRLFNVGNQFELQRSDDDGVSWMPVGAVPNGSFSLTQSSPDRILATTASGAFVSTDSGAAWHAFTNLPCQLKSTSFLAEIPGAVPVDLLRCEDGRLIATEDFGVSWSAMPTEPWPATVNLLSHQDQAVPGRLWVYSLGGDWNGLWRLDPGPAQTWTAVFLTVMPRSS